MVLPAVVRGFRARRSGIARPYKKRAGGRFSLDLAHDAEQLVAGPVEVDPMALAAEHGRSGAEVAAHRGKQRRRHGFGLLLRRNPHIASFDSRGDDRMPDRPVFVLAQEAAEPSHPFAPNDPVGVDPPFQVGDIRHVTADVDDHSGFHRGCLGSVSRAQ